MDDRHCFREFLRHCSLSVLGMLGLSCYILADTFFISRKLGANGLAALNLAIPVYSFIHGSGLMLGMGGSARYSVLRGQGDRDEARRIFSASLCTGLIAAAFFVLAGFLFPGWLSVLLGASGETLSMTRTYLTVLLLFSPAFLLNDTLICFVRADGGPGLSMAAMLTGSFLNVLLDYLLIFPFDMGIFGAVLATGLSPVFSVLVLSLHWRSGACGLFPVKSPFRSAAVPHILALGFPSLVTEVASGVVMIVFNQIILNLSGSLGVAAYGVIANLSLVAVAVLTGVAQGVQPLVGRAYGRRETPSLLRLLHWSAAAVLLLGTGIYAILFLFAGPVVRCFNSENIAALQDMAVPGLRIYFAALFFAGPNTVGSVFFVSTENPRPAHALSLLRGVLLIVPLAFLFSALGGMTGVWMAFPVTEGLVCLLTAVLWRRRPS